MKLQLAIDAPEHLGLIRQLAPYFDIIEIGTPVLKRFGLSAIATARELAPNCAVLADTKTVDGGALEAAMMFGAGASSMTVLAESSAATRRAVQKLAAEHDAEVIFDTIIDSDIDVSGLEPTYPGGPIWVGVHRGSDARLAGEINGDAHQIAIERHHQAGRRVCLAGGFGPDNIEEILQANPDIAVIGSSVTESADPESQAKRLRDALDASIDRAVIDKVQR